jgi:NAD+-dependent secondary alcohol dehydrogenase Adh1
VLCRACRSGDDVHCEASSFPGIDTNGGYAEYLKTVGRHDLATSGGISRDWL